MTPLIMLKQSPFRAQIILYFFIISTPDCRRNTSSDNRVLNCILRIGNHKPSADYRICVTLNNVQTIDQQVNNNILMRSVWLPCEMHDRWAKLFAAYHLHGYSNLTPIITTTAQCLSLTTLTTTPAILRQ